MVEAERTEMLIARTPALGALHSLAKMASALRRGGRQHKLERIAKKNQAALSEGQLRERPKVELNVAK